MTTSPGSRLQQATHFAGNGLRKVRPVPAPQVLVGHEQPAQLLQAVQGGCKQIGREAPRKLPPANAQSRLHVLARREIHPLRQTVDNIQNAIRPFVPSDLAEFVA
jgi:hypothetical protein